MDFFERLFHFSPDGGSGATELSYLVGFLFAGFILFFRKRVAGFVLRLSRRT